MSKEIVRASREGLSVVGLFAGVGGIEHGLRSVGHQVELLAEIDPAAKRVLQTRFEGVPILGDVQKIKSLPRADVVVAGFPCQDLSSAGRTNGISGTRSSLVSEVFRLLGALRPKPRWLVLENVPFMLNLQKGRAMRVITEAVEGLGYRWAYRTVDTRAFGLPQRRQRVIFLASRTEDPTEVLFADHAGAEPCRDGFCTGYGFYWTEGNRGVGWAPDAIPTLKGGSGCGIPSPPSIWNRTDGSIVIPDIRDAERLQGFPPAWTSAADEEGGRAGVRWRLVGNAVSVPVARWLGRRLLRPGKFDSGWARPRDIGKGWPPAAWGEAGRVYSVMATPWPLATTHPPIIDFLRYPLRPLSERAAAGFLGRARASRLRFAEGFLDAIERHVTRMRALGDVGSARRPSSSRSAIR